MSYPYPYDFGYPTVIPQTGRFGAYPPAVKTWEDGARQALHQVMESYEILDQTDVFLLLGLKELYDKMAWNMLAMTARWELGSSFNENDFLALLARKQHDYGPENILKFGQEGLNVRLWDKVARKDNLQKRVPTVLDTDACNGTGKVVALNESIDDTLTDIIGYVVVKQMLANGTFTKPLLADVISTDHSAGLSEAMSKQGFPIGINGGISL